MKISQSIKNLVRRLLLRPDNRDEIDVILYTRADCHLCQLAEELLREYDLQPRKIDIDRNKKLREQFTTCVPVVEINGKIRFRGHVEPVLLKRLLRHIRSNPR